jgi:hypothetical protein
LSWDVIGGGVSGTPGPPGTLTHHQIFPVTGGETVFAISEDVASPESIIFFVGPLKATLGTHYSVSGPANRTITLLPPVLEIRSGDLVVAHYQKAT